MASGTQITELRNKMPEHFLKDCGRPFKKCSGTTLEIERKTDDENTGSIRTDRNRVRFAYLHLHLGPDLEQSLSAKLLGSVHRNHEHQLGPAGSGVDEEG